MAAYVDALCTEMRDWGLGIGSASPIPQSPVTNSEALTRANLRPTVFLGGGTPSMLPLPLMEQVLAAANELVPLAGAEVTVEANPGTVLGRDCVIYPCTNFRGVLPNASIVKVRQNIQLLTRRATAEE